MASSNQQAKFDLRTICDALGGIATKWFKIGIQLGIPYNKMQEFEECRDPFAAVIDYWLRGNVTESVNSISWDTIVTALKSKYVGEPGLAEEISKGCCNQEVTVVTPVNGSYDPTAATEEQESSQEEKDVRNQHVSPRGQMDPGVRTELERILERNLKEIIFKFASYVDCLRIAIRDKGVTADDLRSYLLSVPATSQSCKGQKLFLLSDKEAQLQKCDTITDIFNFLKTKCASFLNYDIFQFILQYYEISDNHEKLQYPEHLKAYINKHKVSEFTKVNPLLKPKNGSNELILKYDIETTCSLAKLTDLKKLIADIMEINSLALEIVDIEEGCVIVKFFISASIADAFFTPDTVFTPQQEEKLRAASVLWLKCDSRTFHFNKQDEAIQKLREQLTCSICISTYTNPKQLQCQHAYCQQCLMGLVQHSQQGQPTLTCPTCRKVTPVPENGVIGLQADFRANQLLEIVGKDLTKGMSVLPSIATTEQREESLEENASHVKKLPHCSDHEKILMEIYCETCSEAICWKCSLKGGKHYGHDTEALDEAFMQCNQSIRSLSKATVQAIAKFDTHYEEISKQQAAIEEKVCSTVTLKTKSIRQSQLTQAKLKGLAAQRDQIETIQAQLNKHLYFMGDTSNQKEALLMKITTVKQVKEVITTFPPDSFESSMKKWHEINYQPAIEGGHELLECLDIRGSLFPKAPVGGLKLPILTIGEMMGPRGVAVNRRGEVVVIESKAHCVTVLTPRGERLRTFGTRGSRLGQFLYPYGVALDAEGNILVTDTYNHRIQKFSPQGDFLTSVGDRNSAGSLKFDHPSGIVFNARNSKIYVGDESCRIQVLNSDLSYFSTFGKRGHGKGEFIRPRHLACDSTGNVYVADWGNHRIQVFTAEGEFLRMFGSKRKPHFFGIAIDASDGVYTTDYQHHNICVYSREGQLVTSFGRKGREQGHFYWPTGIAVDDSGVVYVCDLRNNRVQLFEFH